MVIHVRWAAFLTLLYASAFVLEATGVFWSRCHFNESLNWMDVAKCEVIFYNVVCVIKRVTFDTKSWICIFIIHASLLALVGKVSFISICSNGVWICFKWWCKSYNLCTAQKRCPGYITLCSTLLARKHSSRMYTTHLPTVATRCQH